MYSSPFCTVCTVRQQDLQACGEEDADDEDAEDEDDMPDDLRDLSPAEQQRMIKWRAACMMGLGSVIVILISDPMVDVLSEIGKRTQVPAFYVAFVLAPMASNASELVAAYNYAQKKTRATISISLATLLGAAIMNNTFVLGKRVFVLVFVFITNIISGSDMFAIIFMHTSL